MSETAFQAKPWEQPIWKPARGQAGAFAFLVIVHVLAVVGLILFPLPGWGPVLGAAALVALGLLGLALRGRRGRSRC